MINVTVQHADGRADTAEADTADAAIAAANTLWQDALAAGLEPTRIVFDLDGHELLTHTPGEQA